MTSSKKLDFKATPFKDFCEEYGLDYNKAMDDLTNSNDVCFGGKGLTLVTLGVLLEELGIYRINLGDDPEELVFF